MFRPFIATAFLFFASVGSTRADSFLWSGPDGTFSNPGSWSGPAPLPPGSPSQKLIFPLSNIYPPYTATIDLPWTLNNLTFTGKGGIFLSAAPGSGLLFDGSNPSILRTVTIGGLPFDSPGITFNTPITTTSGLTFDGGSYTLTGPLASTGGGTLSSANGASITYQNNASLAGFSQVALNGGSFAWNVSVPDSNPVNLSLGSPIVGSGSLIIDLMLPVETTSAGATLSNPIVVQGALTLGGTASKVPLPSSYDSDFAWTYAIALQALPPISPASLNFTGPILLGGPLTLSSNLPNPMGLSAQSTIIELSGTITLDQSNANELSLSPDWYSQNLHSIISGNIVDDPNAAHSAHKPLLLVTSPAGHSLDGDFIIAGTHNTYSTGTIIDDGHFTIAPGSSLGTGPITVNFGTLNLTSPSNLHPGQTVLLQYAPWATLAINFDALPYAFLDPASAGILALNTTFTTPLDMAKVGNGRMSLSSNTNGIYAADTLRPGSDHVYRLTGNLTLIHSVLADYDGIQSSALLDGATLAAANSYSGGTTVSGWTNAAAPGALGTGNITVGTYPGYPWAGILYLSAPNAYLPTTKVDVIGTLSAVGPNGSIPLSNTPPILHPGSALILGDGISTNPDRYPDAMPVNLDGVTLILKGLGTTNETVGPITVSGVSTIVLNNPATGSNATTLIAASISRQSHGVLFIVPFQYPSDPFHPVSLPFAPAGDNAANVQVIAPLSVTNGMVAPWIQSRGLFYDNLNYIGDSSAPASFLNYSPSGFSFAPYVSMPVNSGTGTEIVDIPAESGGLTIIGDKSLYALRASASILTTDPTIPTIHITSGGLITESHISANFLPVVIQPNVDFGNSEALITVQGVTSLWDTKSLDIQGVVTANNGLTKVGTGTLRLSNPNNQIHGPLTILEGTLELASIPDPTSTDPIQLSGQGGLNFLNSTNVTRPINITSTGDLYPIYGASITTPAGHSLTIAAPITAQGAININGGETLRVNAPITATNLLFLIAPNIILSSNLSAGSFLFSVGRQGKITGNAVLSSANSILFDSGAISPGHSAGDLATLTFNVPEFGIYDGASFLLELDAAGHSDRILITGDFTIGNTPWLSGDPTLLALNFLAPPTGETYTLVSASQITGTFDTVTGLPPGYTVQYTPTSIQITPSVNAPGATIPEPSTAALFLTASCTLLTFHRRRRVPKQTDNWLN